MLSLEHLEHQNVNSSTMSLRHIVSDNSFLTIRNYKTKSFIQKNHHGIMSR